MTGEAESLPVDLTDSWSACWNPPPVITLSQWAEANFKLSSEYAARAGRLRLFGWQKDILDAYTDPFVNEIVCKTAVQVIKTLFIQCAIAYTIAQDPGPMLLIEPKDDDALKFSRMRLTPMIRDNPCLRSVYSSSNKDPNNTLTNKIFPGGSLSIVGSGSAGNLAALTIRAVFADEINKYPKSAISSSGEKEGSPVYIASKRTATFGSRRKIIKCCSPTVPEGDITLAYAASDQRKPWAKCQLPGCGEYQVLQWKQVVWDNTLPIEQRPATAKYECMYCKSLWNDAQRVAAANASVWRAEKPFTNIAGFWISHLYSPWHHLADLVQEYLKVKDNPREYQVFLNTVLAEEYREAGETPNYELLYARRETYPFGDNAVIPQRVCFLTAAVDVQINPPRLEVEVFGWGRNRENWSIAYEVIQVRDEEGNLLPVDHRALWDELDLYILQRLWRHESGKGLFIRAMAIDTGNRAAPVYEFCRRQTQPTYSPTAGLRVRSPRTVVAVKGLHREDKMIGSISDDNAARKQRNVRIMGVGTDYAKLLMFDALKNVVPALDGTLSGMPMANCCHTPMYPLEYYLGLTAEVRVFDDRGKASYKKIRDRNEPVDTRVYANAMAVLVGIDSFTDSQWSEMGEALAPLALADAPLAAGVLESESSSLSHGVVAVRPPAAVATPAVNQPTVQRPIQPIPQQSQPRPRGPVTRGRFF